MASSEGRELARTDEPQTAETIRYIEVAPVPTVVQPEEVHEVREAAFGTRAAEEALSERIEGLVSGYYLPAARAEAEMVRLLAYLARRDRGAALLINGVYGSGKTHLLALLGLLCESAEAQAQFRKSHPSLTEGLGPEAPTNRLTVYCSLEAYSGKRHDLEQVLWEATTAELSGRGLSWECPGAAERATSRDETLRSLLEFLDAQGLSGCVWLLDELSMFLGSKTAAQLQNDTSFLQFLAQRATRHPVWLVASVQRSLEHLGDLDAHSLRQIRDRFEAPITLSLAHTHRLLSERLVPRTDAEAFAAAVRTQAALLNDRFPRLDWGWEQLAASYPFHPATVDCLERVVGRFFSRTRSAVGFLQTEAQRFVTEHGNHTKATELITPDRLFDHFRPDLESNPELREYVVQVWRHHEANMPDIAPVDPDYACQLVKLLTVQKIGAQYPTVAEATNHLLFDSGLPGQGSYGYTQSVLEALRTRGDYVTVRRRAELFADQYTLDVGARLGAALRRRLTNMSHTFAGADSRLAQAAFAACDARDWPLARLVAGHTFSAHWRHDRFSVHCRLAAPDDLDTERLANERALLANPGTEEDMHLLLADPLAVKAQVEAWESSSAGLEESRWNAGLVFWAPRPPELHERALLAEHAAVRLLESDPSLRDNPRGQRMLELLREDAPGLATQVRHLLRELYAAGHLLDAGGERQLLSRSATELPEWTTALGRLLGWRLPVVFPASRGLPVALATGLGSASAELAESRLSADARGPSPRVRELSDHLAAVGEDLRRTVFELVPDRDFLTAPESSNLIELGELVQRLHKSELGATMVLLEPVLAGLLADGELQPLSGELNLLSTRELSVPLSDSVHGLCRGQVVSADDWESLREVAGALLAVELPPQPTCADQEALWRELVDWQEGRARSAGRASARLTQIRRALEHSPADWRHTLSDAQDMQSLLAAIDPRAPARKGLSRLLAVTRDTLASGGAGRLAELNETWEQAVSFLTDLGNEVLLANAYLGEPGLSLPAGPLADGRAMLLEKLGTGERLIAHAEDFSTQWSQWLGEYAAAYRQWHDRVYAPDRFRPYAELRQSALATALRQLDRLRLELPCSGADLLTRVGREHGKCCDRPGLAASLRAFPHCSHCRLRLGEEIELTPPAALAKQLGEAFRRNAAIAFTNERRERWQTIATSGTSGAHRRLAELARALPEDTTPESVAGCLTDEVIALLLSAAPQPTANTRRLRDLRQQLAGRTVTLTEARQLACRWLDPTGSLPDTEALTFED